MQGASIHPRRSSLTSVALMGKKRQKVQWFPVDGLAWAGGEDGALQVGGGHQVATRASSHVQ